MNKEILKTSLKYFYDNQNDIAACIYSVLKNDETDENNLSLYQLDIESTSQGDLKKLFLDFLKEAILDNEDVNLLKLSSSDERQNAMYIYDLDDIPAELTYLDDIIKSDDHSLLDLSSNSLNKIKALIIEIGNNDKQIVLYKLVAPINIFNRQSFFLKKSKTRLEKIDDEFLRVVPAFDVIKIDDVLIIKDIKFLEKHFGFHNIIKKNAELGMNTIKNLQLVENPDVLTELIDEVKWARKFVKVNTSSPVIKAKIPNESIIEFCKNFPKLSKKIRFNEDGDKILLDTKVSKDLFIKVLMDDFLTSELTTFHYESVAKDSLEDEENQ